ncbi:MAG: hypothetical protein LBQ11_01445 [Candidatus Nomurabacteria bacterium]|jgi:hypothetical protein|nr:hypothetical protein [Candidatus Nomurabacteria bacterium]
MKIGRYIGGTVLAIAALYVIFLGCAMILAVFENITWDEVWSTSAKVGIIALILLAINIAIAGLVGLMPQKTGKK